MMHVRKGFTLIECIVYVTICAFFSLLVFKFYALVSIHCAKIKKAIEVRSLLDMVQDRMRRDILQASADVKYSASMAHELVLQLRDQNIGWRLEKERLYRIVGIYDFEHKAWKTSAKTIVAMPINSFATELIMIQGMLRGVKVNIIAKSLDMAIEYRNQFFLLEGAIL